MSQPPPAHPQPGGTRGRARQTAHGPGRPWADPAHARGHVRKLLEISTFQAIAAAANVGQMTVWEIANATRPVIKAQTASALLAVTPADARPQRVDANGSMWRLRSLLAMGHATGRIAAALGVSRTIIGPLIRGDRATVAASLRDDITRLFDAWWDKRPPRRTPAEKAAACKARQRAAVHNWPCPAALDEDELDRPGHKPTERWRYAHGTGIAGDDPLGNKRQTKPQPGRGGGHADRPADPNAKRARQAKESLDKMTGNVQELRDQRARTGGNHGGAPGRQQEPERPRGAELTTANTDQQITGELTDQALAGRCRRQST